MFPVGAQPAIFFFFFQPREFLSVSLFFYFIFFLRCPPMEGKGSHRNPHEPGFSLPPCHVICRRWRAPRTGSREGGTRGRRPVDAGALRPRRKHGYQLCWGPSEVKVVTLTRSGSRPETARVGVCVCTGQLGRHRGPGLGDAGRTWLS